MSAENINNESRENERALRLADIWAMVWNNRIWYIISIAVCLSIAVFKIYKTPKSFSATAKVIVGEESENSTLRTLASFTNTRRSYYNSGPNIFNEMEAFTSPDLMKIVAGRLGLETKYTSIMPLRTRELYTSTPVAMTLCGENPMSSFSFVVKNLGEENVRLSEFKVSGRELDTEDIQARLGDTLTTPLGRILLAPTPNTGSWKRDVLVSWTSAGSLARGLAGRLGVSLSNKESSVLVLTYTDLFPSRAVAVISSVIDVYNEEWIHNKNRNARNTTAFINDRLNVIEKELGGVEQNLKNYKEKNKITDISQISQLYLSESSAYSSKAFEIGNQLSIARMIKKWINDPEHGNSIIPSTSGINSSSIEGHIREYNEAIIRRDRLMAGSSKENPVVADISESLETIKVAINRSVDNLIATLQLQSDELERHEDELMGRVASTSGQELQLLSIERQQKVKEQLYIYLLQKREENEIASLVDVSNTRMIMSPVGGGPVAPNVRMILLLALVLGAGIPFGIFFLIAQFDTRVKNRIDLSELKVPFLAEIPQLGIKGNWLERHRADRYNDHNTQIVVKPGKRNSVNEAFRVLRTNLDMMLGRPGYNKAHRVMVTSVHPNAGKTFLILNTASTFAVKGARTLLIDLDLRKGTLSKVVSGGKVGLAAYLNEHVDSVDDLVVSVRDNLDVLPCGTLPPNPAELLLSTRFTEMIDYFSSKYDYIFFDCPPMDLVTDSSIIGRMAEITIMVVRVGMFDKRAVPMLDALYEEGRYNRMTIVLNGVEYNGHHKSSYGYGYGYGYGAHSYGYGYGYGYGYSSHGYGYGEGSDDDDDADDNAAEVKENVKA